MQGLRLRTVQSGFAPAARSGKNRAISAYPVVPAAISKLEVMTLLQIHTLTSAKLCSLGVKCTYPWVNQHVTIIPLPDPSARGALLDSRFAHPVYPVAVQDEFAMLLDFCKSGPTIVFNKRGL
jgi:hypothetical protein